MSEQQDADGERGQGGGQEIPEAAPVADQRARAASTTRISAAWSRPSAGIAVAAPNPQASPTPDTVRRTPRNASAGEAARRTSPSRHHVRRPAAAVTPLTQPIVTLKGNEFHTSAATTSTSTTWMLSASGRPLSS